MATLEQYKNDPRVTTGLVTLVIPAGEATAAAPLDCEGVVAVGLYIPSGFTASSITFQGLPYPVNPNVPDVANDDLASILDPTTGSALSITIAAGQAYLPLLPIYFNGIRFLNITTSTPQVDECVISVALVPLYQTIT